ncbi:19696_t:CDS:2 [Dentiscutata erythropus]|uniref:19696_t:CDS:1 n=1 Tax=Dentiscutata erythropus TaxID=1348616 RepID=A0A9N9H6G3_9GLOM|nr:19696_t:CDS:2 [Dentiscutata erythropus]
MFTSPSTSTSVKRTFDQSEDLSTMIITIKKNYNYYLDLSNWQLNTEVDEDAYVEAFPLLSDHYESFDGIQEWRTTILQGPKSGAKIAFDKSSFAPVLYYCPYCNHFRKINFCKHCKKSIDDDDFDSESNESATLSSIIIITEEFQKSLKNKGIFDNVIEKYSAKYITSQSRTVENKNIFWSDNELQMDDSDNEFII